ncbi:MAG: MarR family transcriptional regulator [Candidatus Dormibacteraeota bacterium]|nr:MarR family transcriptional regulator [Candidatus Dormibacteraeota bacterium]
MKDRQELIERLSRAQVDLKVRIQGLVEPMVSAELGDLGSVTVHQMEVVRRVLSGAEMTMHELAVSAGVGPSAATQLVDRLERRGLVERTRDENDRRVQRVVPTDLARSLSQRFRSSLTKALAAAFVVLDDEELATYVGLAERVARGGAAAEQSGRRRSA